MLGRYFANTPGGAAGLGLLIVRLVFGFAMMLHGYPKIQNPFHWADRMGIPGPLQALAALAEAGGGLAIALGLLTPLAALGWIATMGVAIFQLAKMGAKFVVNPPAEGPALEPAAGYLAVAILLLLVGPGKFSFDALLFGGKGGKVKAGR